MKHLLVKYDSCDTFSLTCPYNDGYCKEYPYGKYKLDKHDGEQAAKKLEDFFKKNLFDRYNACKDEIDNLPDFNINQIGSEDLLDKEEEKHDDFITIESKTKVPEESVKEILSSNEVMNNVKKFLNGGTIN